MEYLVIIAIFSAAGLFYREVADASIKQKTGLGCVPAGLMAFITIVLIKVFEGGL